MISVSLCQKNEGSVEIKHRPIEMGCRTIYITLWPKRHFFKLWLTEDPTCERWLEKDKSVTHILCDFETITWWGEGWKIFGFIKKTTSYGIEKKCIYSTYSPWAPHTYDLFFLTSLTHPRKIILIALQTTCRWNMKSQWFISTPKYLRFRHLGQFFINKLTTMTPP
jgi:hypothetical protein